jgi:hypothetical protein
MLWQVKKRCISNSLPFQLGKIEKLGPHNPTPRLLTGLLLALLGPPREREEAAAGPSRTGRLLLYDRLLLYVREQSRPPVPTVKEGGHLLLPSRLVSLTSHRPPQVLWFQILCTPLFILQPFSFRNHA